MRDRVLQDELDHDTQQGLWAVEPEQFIDDGVVDSLFADLPHGDELLADFEKQCKEYENE